MIQDSRIKPLNLHPAHNGEYVLYWMQSSQRAYSNHALEYAVQRANELGQPVLVGFGLTDSFPEANLRHYSFMLEGLRETAQRLSRRGIALVLRIGSPPEVALELASKASLVVCDRGYLRIQRAWREQFVRNINCETVQVESDAVVPVETASGKEEIGARTLRPKIKRILYEYLTPVRQERLRQPSLNLDIFSESLDQPSALLSRLCLDCCVKPSPVLKGGISQARKSLREFIRRKLQHYAENRSDPSLGIVSNMSPYLHFGQISPIEIASEIVNASDSPAAARDAYLEELIIRRELGMNLVFYNPRYDQYDGLPAWARITLAEHASDPRPYRYDLDRLEHAHTHDPYWNAAQQQMLLTGTMHNYMRMYWGKKILEWTADPEEAFQRTLYLNNKYQLDGRDPNSFAGVAWCFGTHDRAWFERPVFGKIRYMNDAGLKRKFNIDDYVRQIDQFENCTVCRSDRKVSK